mmetsp:Transcript_99553/g.172827  ORF Transcript_99553/g.172827 Transcript_99553/m.172827 type:complete len:160 (-) Transcript_99553:90-569(-)
MDCCCASEAPKETVVIPPAVSLPPPAKPKKKKAKPPVDESDQKPPIAEPEAESKLALPGTHEIPLTRQAGEKWGIDIDYACKPLKIVGISESGAVAKYNSKNSNRQIEVDDRIVQINGEEKGVFQNAMLLAKANILSVRMLIQKKSAFESDSQNGIEGA